MTRSRSWPFVAALVAFVAGLGLLPHLRFSLAIGEVAAFFSAYDEPAYALWAFEGGGPLLPHRWLSSAALRALATAGDGSWRAALILADALLPALCAWLAWRLSGHVTRRRTLRLAAALSLLFAQELFSLGCWTIWQLGEPLGVPGLETAVHDLRDLRERVPAWVAVLWPDYTSPFLTIFRTPEPQLSLVLLYGALVVLAELGREPRSPRRLRTLLAIGAAVNLVLVASYFFVAAAIVVLQAALSASLLAWGRRRAAARVGLLTLVGAAAVLIGVLAFHSSTTAQGYSFSSRLPVITPASALSALGVLLLVVLRRSARAHSELLPLAAACFASVLFLTNQQLVSGRMITTQYFERFVDYPLLGLGVALTAAWILRGSGVRVEALYAAAGAWLVTAALLLVQAQDRVFEEEFLVANLKSVAAKRAVELVEAQGVRDPLLVLEDPELDLIVQARLERRLNHLLDVTRVFERPIEPLQTPQGRWGARSPSKREAYEYFARRPRTPAGVERILAAEADAGAGTFLRFFFDPRDFWTTLTDGRGARLADVSAQVSSIREDYEAYLKAGDPCWARPVVVLTRQNVEERANPRWRERLLAEVTVGRQRPLMNMHAYLQQPADAAVATPGTCE